MKIKFIGTGSGFTSLARFHSSLLITSKNYNLLVDCGDGVSQAILTQNINYNIIDAILISHLHPDHYSGLPSLITQMKLGERKKELSIFVHSSNKDFIEDFIYHSYLFKERMNFKLNVIPFDEEKEIILIDDFCLTSKLNSHLDKYQTDELKNNISFISLSFLFKDDENSCIYTGDIGSEKDLYLFNQKVDWLIAEITHVKFENLIEIFEKLNLQKIVLTHVPDNFEIQFEKYLESIANHLKSRFILAFDGLELKHYNSDCL
ncbi:MAG: ribonuclease Z [Ignavibacteriales bacterium]|nr:ribonuclease Z [Ignavibacteriales bacterium]